MATRKKKGRKGTSKFKAASAYCRKHTKAFTKAFGTCMRKQMKKR